MEPAFLVVAPLAAFLTSILSAVLGMAGGLVLMGVYLWALPVEVAMVLHGVTQMFANGFRAWLGRAAIDWSGVGGYALGGLASFAALGAFAIVLERPIVFLLLGAIPLLIARVPSALVPRFDRPAGAIACGASVTAAHLLAGVSGPILDSFFVGAKLDRFRVIATKALTQTSGHVLKIAYFGFLAGSASIFDSVPLWLYPLLVACAYLGTRTGTWILQRVSEAQFRRWTANVVSAIALFYVWRGVSELGWLSAW